MAAYLLGGDDPFAGDAEAKDAKACARARACTTTMRSEIGSGALEVRGDGLSQSCGVSVATFSLNATSDMADVDFDDAARCAAELDACWGPGVSGFFLAERSERERKIHIDPEPADLGAPLGNVTGSTAEARYVYSGLPTTVLEWPNSWTSGQAPAGTPCSNTPLPAGSITSQVIVLLAEGSSFRKCM